MAPATMRSNRVAVVLLVLGLLTSCGLGTEPENPRACPQTYEFGNYGCARIEGVVVGSADQPLEAILVGPRYLEGRECCNTPYVQTNEDGEFKLTLTRFLPPPELRPTPDTLTIFIHAQRRPPGPSSGEAISDSVAVVVEFTAIGKVSVPTAVKIHLPIP